jgi:hypothetical protein
VVGRAYKNAKLLLEGLVIYLKGLQSKEEHLRLARASGDALKLVTVGLSERNVRLRKLDFINKDTVIANFDNNRKDIGGGAKVSGALTPSSRMNCLIL